MRDIFVGVAALALWALVIVAINISDTLDEIRTAILMRPVKSMVEAERVYVVEKVETTKDSAGEWEMGIEYSDDIDLCTMIMDGAGSYVVHIEDCPAYNDPLGKCVYGWNFDFLGAGKEKP